MFWTKFNSLNENKEIPEEKQVAVFKENTPALQAKMKKNLLWLFMFSAIMIFGGITSGYIVSQGGNYWVNVKMPSAFNISTIIIIISSLILVLARFFIKKSKQSIAKVLLGIALVLGMSFGYFQLKGWQQLHRSGNALSGSIININGQYGKYYTFYYEGKEISYDNASFYYKGEEMSADLLAKMKKLSSELMAGAKSKDRTYKLSAYGSEFTLRYKGELVTYINNELSVNGGKFSQEISSRLWYFSENIVNDRGDFIMKGKYGEDFKIFYHGNELQYTNRTFFIDGKPLSAKQLNDLNMQDNTASSYIYAFTFLHLLHWLGGIISLSVMFINGLRLKYTATDMAGLKLGSTYWHFLGILWLYLYAFLIFIH